MSTKNRDDYRREKELEEARKAGIAPAAVDTDGKMINPHIPQYMTKGLWYLNQEDLGTTLQHQRYKKQDESKDAWYDRGAKVHQATKYRPGACENCGSMSHKTKDCLERPRKIGAKFTNKHIAADELVTDVSLNQYDAKRDRWNGYDANEYAKVMDRFEKVEELRREKKQQELREKKYSDHDKMNEATTTTTNTTTAAAAGDADPANANAPPPATDDEDRLDEAEALNFDKIEKRVNTTSGGATGTIRNLRIREDTAKYLLNLDLDSAFYDPKSRSMREDPNPNKPMHEKYYAGDNFVRNSGQEYREFMALQLHALEAGGKGDAGADTHAHAAPSQAEALFREFQSRKANLVEKKKAAVLDKYGNETTLLPDDVALLGATEAYVEYDRTGRVVRGVASRQAKSRYAEDVHPQNHVSVWGSYWHDGMWGYDCCHSMVKGSVCMGKKNIELEDKTRLAMEERSRAVEEKKERERQERKEREKEGGKEVGGEVKVKGMAAGAWGMEVPDGVVLDEDKVLEALKRLEEDETRVETDDRKRSYHAFKAGDGGMSAEEMEAYRRKRGRNFVDDPVAAMKREGEKKGEGSNVGGKYDFV